MRILSTAGLALIALGALTMGTGCAGALVQPGHRALYFDPVNGGIQHEVLQPGWYRTACPFWTPDNKCPRVDDFDVTYSTAKEPLHTLSLEKLPLELHMALKYRPIVSELYLLDTEIGPNYFEEVIGPEFRSAAIGVLARTSYVDLQTKNGMIEDEIEKELRQRLHGKHIEVSSVLIEKVTYAPEILQSEKDRVVSQEQTLRNKQLLENEASQTKTRLELAAEAEQNKLTATTKLAVEKIQIQKDTDEEKFRIESALRNKEAERKLTIQQAQIDKMKADADAAARISQAKGQATARIALAKATAEENQAAAATVGPMQVMMHAYDALGQLGGTGTTMMLGDWSKMPAWLFPHTGAFQNAFGPYLAWPGAPGTPAAPAPNAGKVSLTTKNGGSTYASTWGAPR